MRGWLICVLLLFGGVCQAQEPLLSEPRLEQPRKVYRASDPIELRPGEILLSVDGVAVSGSVSAKSDRQGQLSRTNEAQGYSPRWNVQGSMSAARDYGAITSHLRIVHKVGNLPGTLEGAQRMHDHQHDSGFRPAAADLLQWQQSRQSIKTLCVGDL